MKLKVGCTPAQVHTHTDTHTHSHTVFLLPPIAVPIPPGTPHALPATEEDVNSLPSSPSASSQGPLSPKTPTTMKSTSQVSHLTPFFHPYPPPPHSGLSFSFLCVSKLHLSVKGII